MSDLSEFLLARISEDETVAREAAASKSGESYESRAVGLSWTAKRGLVCGDVDPELKLWDNEGAESLEMSPPVAVHVARHDPARVLAECETKLQVIEAAWGDHLQIEGEWGHCRSREELSAVGDYPEVVRSLALPYADHPDYDESWRL